MDNSSIFLCVRSSEKSIGSTSVVVVGVLLEVITSTGDCVTGEDVLRLSEEILLSSIADNKSDSEGKIMKDNDGGATNFHSLRLKFLFVTVTVLRAWHLKLIMHQQMMEASE